MDELNTVTWQKLLAEWAGIEISLPDSQEDEIEEELS